MTRRTMLGFGLIALMAGAAPAAAQEEQDVAYSIGAINELVVAGSPVIAIVTSAELLGGVSDETATWSIVTNQTGMRVDARVAGLDAGVTLKALFLSAGGAVERTLSGSDQEMASFTTESASGAIRYTVSGTEAAGPIAAGLATVTYTVVAGS
jgi:hypothetical protein